MITRSSFGALFALLVLGSSGASAGTLVVDRAQSRLEVAVHATVDSFTARLAAFDPVISVDAVGNVTDARLAFHFRDLQTGKAKRDAAMHKWQQTETYPDGQFDLTSLRREGDTLMASGRLTLHGVSRAVRFPVSIARDGATYAIDADAPIDTQEFDLPVIRMLGLLKVDPRIHVRFHIQGTQPQNDRAAL